MAYKIKRGSTEQQEKYLEKRTKGHPSFAQIERFEIRRFYQIAKKLNTKGEIVEYNDGKIGKIKKVTNRGIYVQEFKDEKEKGLFFENPTGKLTFFSEKEIEAGKVYPIDLIPYSG